MPTPLKWPATQIHWHEGLFLQPHHFQWLERGWRDQSHASRRLSWHYPYGVIDASLSEGDLANRKIQFTRLHVVMPSGLEPLWNYLRHIFAYGPFSRPLFFRGIYFNSSMQEGAALDEQLARALRLPVGALPGGGAFKQDRSLFLPDLFREKVFGETELVVRATSTLRLLRAWQVAFYCCAFAAVLFWLILAAVGMRSFRESVGNQRDYWNLVRNSWESPFTNSTMQLWQPIVDPTTHKYRGDSRDLKPPLKAEGTTFNLIEFHAQLRNQAETNIQVRWVFKPLEWLIRPDLDRRRAQRIAFEGSVIRPLVLLSQAKMEAAFDPTVQKEALEAGELGRHQRALESLLRFEAEVFDRHSGIQRRLAQHETLKKEYLQPWLNYVLDSELKDTNLTSLAFTMERTYSGSDGRLEAWPPQALSRGFSLSENRAISNGLVRLKVHVRAKLSTAEDLGKIQPLTQKLQAFKLAELQYTTALSKSQPVDALYHTLEQNAQALQAALEQACKPGGILAANPYSLADAYAALQQKADKTYKEAFGGVKALTTLPSEKRSKAFPLFAEVAEFLVDVRNADILRPFENAMQTGYELKELDRVYLAPCGQTTQRLFQVRWDTYSTSHKLMNKFPLVFTDNPDSLSEQEVQKAGRVLGSATSDPLAAGNLPQEHINFLEPFQRKLLGLRPVVQALLTTNSEIETCRISVWTNNVRKDWRGIKLTGASHSSKVQYIDRHEVLGTVKLSEPFELKVFRTADEAEGLVYTLVPKDKDWTVLRWLRAPPQGKPELPGRTNWIIEMYPPGPDGKQNGHPLSFKLEFHAQLPELDRWPKAMGTAP